MAKLRKVKKNGHARWRVSWYDALGQRRQRFFARKGDADRLLSDAIKASQQRLEPAIDPNATVDAYAAHWLPLHAGARGLKPRTVESYESTLRTHVTHFPLPGRSVTVGELK